MWGPIIYVDSAFTSSGNFNGWIFELTDPDSPIIVNATLDTSQSSFSESQMRVDHDDRRVFVNGEGIFINQDSSVFIRLELANP